MERNTVTNSQYSRRETVKLNPVPAEIHKDSFEESIFKALSLTGVNVVLEYLHACHRMKKSGRVIVKFKGSLFPDEISACASSHMLCYG